MVSIIRNEHFDVDMMEKLLRHEGVSQKDKTMLRKYKKRAIDGNQVQTKYVFGKNWAERGEGRLFPEAGLGLASMSRKIRGALAKRFYFDVDIENAQPTILRELCKRESWDCPVLEEFIEKRTTILKEMMTSLGMTRGEAKDDCIAVLFGGYRSTHNILMRLSQELEKIKKNAVGHYPDLHAYIKKLKDKEVHDNIAGSLLAIVLQDQERQILFHMDEYLKEHGRPLCVLIHDGGFIRRVEGEETIPQELLDGCVAYLKEKTGFDLRLAVKPCEHDFSFNDIVSTTRQRLMTVIKEFEKNHFYLLNSGVVCREDEGSITMRWKTLLACEAIGNKFDYFEDNKFVQVIKEWVRLPTRRTYDRIGFYPGAMPENIFNLYRGPVIASEEAGPDGVPAFKALLSVLLKDDEPAMKFVTQWAAHIFQKPAERVGTAIIFTGEMGIGKDMLWELIGKLLGDKLFFTTDNHEQDILGSFNGLLEGRLLVKMEEVNGQFMRENHDRIKGMITATTRTINIKSVPTYTIDKYERWVMTTNDPVPVVVNKTDRRFNIFMCGESKRGDNDWYTAIWNAMVAGRRSIYDWLMSIDLTDFNRHAIFRTDYHTMLAEGEKPAQERFIDECAEDPLYDKIDRSATDLWKDYSTFCGKNGFQCCHVVHFIRKLGHYIGNGRLVKRILHSKPCYTITVAGAMPVANCIINET
jgi:hypothetical protein